MHQCHEFVMNHVVWYVSGSCTWEEALRHLSGQGNVHRDDVRRLLGLPNADAVPQWQIEDVLRATQGGPSGLTVRHRILRHVPNVAPPPPSAPPRSSVVEARHELRLSSRLMQRLRALVPDLLWTTGNLHMHGGGNPDSQCRPPVKQRVPAPTSLRPSTETPRPKACPQPPPPPVEATL